MSQQDVSQSETRPDNARPDISRQEAQRRARLRLRGGRTRPGTEARRPERLTITSVSPSVSEGAYPSKRVVGDVVEFAAVVVCDGAVEIGAHLRLTGSVRR